jgi:uncharacterized protein (TIGR02588 family)
VTREADPADESAGTEEGTARRATPVLEWVVGGLGTLLVAGAIAFLLYHALVRDGSPPDVRVVTEEVLDLQNGYLVRFRASNEGESAAAQVTIEGELTGPDGMIEMSDVVLDYLAPRSERQGGLLFSENPRNGELRLRATGYSKP